MGLRITPDATLKEAPQLDNPAYSWRTRPGGSDGG
jgi:hypothetical protein